MKSIEKRATIYDVAKLAKVSAATVSRVLKGDASVNAPTCRRVEDAAAALKYERRLRQTPSQNRLVVLNVPSLNNAFYSRIISGAQDAAATEGYHVLVNAQQINDVNVEAFLAMLRSVKAVGLIELNALTTDKSDRYAKWNTGTWPRYYLTAAEAEAVYDSFGFKAAGLSADARVFPNTDGWGDADTIWADAPLKPDSSEGAGGYLIPLCYSHSSNPIHLYYLPNNKTGNPSYFTTSAARNDKQILAENMFYSTVLQDPEGIYTTARCPPVSSMFSTAAERLRCRWPGGSRGRSPHGTPGRNTSPRPRRRTPRTAP